MGATRWLVGVVAAVGTLGAQELAKLTPDLAGQAEGQVATVCGEVAGYDCHAGREYTLIFRTLSTGPAFEVAVDPFEGPFVEKPLASRFFGQRVCATGTVVAIPSGYRIRITGTDQLQVEQPNAEATASTEDVLWCPRPIQLPRIIREVKPNYTAKAIRAGVHGTVELMAIVDADGAVRRAVVKRSLDEDLDQKALEAVRQWQFEPGTREGAPVPVAVSIALTFTVGKKR